MRRRLASLFGGGVLALVEVDPTADVTGHGLRWERAASRKELRLADGPATGTYDRALRGPSDAEIVRRVDRDLARVARGW